VSRAHRSTVGYESRIIVSSYHYMQVHSIRIVCPPRSSSKIHPRRWSRLSSAPSQHSWRSHSRRPVAPATSSFTPLAFSPDRSKDCSRVSASILDPTSVATPPRVSEIDAAAASWAPRRASTMRARSRTPTPPRTRSRRRARADSCRARDAPRVWRRNLRESCAVGASAPSRVVSKSR